VLKNNQKNKNMEQNPNTNPEQQPKPQDPSPPGPTIQEKLAPSAFSPTGRRKTELMDKVCYVSPDEQFVVKQLVWKIAKFPPSSYPVVAVEAYPEVHTRFREIPGGGVELVLVYEEVEQLLKALNEAAIEAGKGQLYQILQHVPKKTAAHKQKWRRYNERRLGISRNGGKYGSK
jgi:hypothetical protein